MLKDIRLHGAITPEIDYYAVLAGEKLVVSHFHEISEGEDGARVAFFQAGQYFKLDAGGLSFSGTGGAVSEYMFGSPMPLNDLGHKEVANRLLIFGAHAGDGGRLAFSPNVAGSVSWRELFVEGNALSNSFFLLKVPWPYSVRRTQEVLLKTLGRMLKRSPQPAAGNDSELAYEILKELAEPAATLLLLRVSHRPNQQFYKFVRGYYEREGEWGASQEHFVSKLAAEIGVEEYQRQRIAIDILYKAGRNRPILDEYKDLLLTASEGALAATDLTRLNTLRNIAVRHGLPPTLFDTLDQLLPTLSGRAEPGYLKAVREILHERLLGDARTRGTLNAAEIARLLSAKQTAHNHHDSGFEQILLDTGRQLDERAAETGDFEAFEVFSELVTYFDRLDNASAVVNQLVFMDHASATEEKIRSLHGNRQAFDSLEESLFYRLVVEPALANPYALKYGKRKLVALWNGLQEVARGEQAFAHVAEDVEHLAQEEHLCQEIYDGIRKRIRLFYFDLSNPAHVRMLQTDVETDVLNQVDLNESGIPTHAFSRALEQIKLETEYLNSVYPRILAGGDLQQREEFLVTSHIDRYRIEELEREYRVARGLEAPAHDIASMLDD